MAAFDTTDLLLDAGGGGLFGVTGNAQIKDFRYAIPSGGEALLLAAQRVVLVRGLPQADPATILYEAAEAANRLLDVAQGAMTAAVSLDTRYAPEVTWWGSPSGVTLRVRSTSTIVFDMSATVTYHGADGQELPPLIPSDPWHPALRLFRASEAASDLLDSFRNVYLALESLLSDVYPVASRADGTPEPEKQWLKRALKEEQSIRALDAYAPPGRGRESLINAIVGDLYSRYRAAMFHAKIDRPNHTPQDWRQRQDLIDARVRYARLFRDLASRHLPITFAGSHMSASGELSLFEGLMSPESEVFLSDDPTRYQDEDGRDYPASPMGRAIASAPASAHLPAHVGGAGTWSAHFSGAALMNAVGGLRRFGVRSRASGQVTIIDNIAGTLDVTGVESLLIDVRTLHRSSGTPKREFST